MCNKIVQHSSRNIGKTYKSACNKPEYKEGLCEYHYNRKIEKSKNWIDKDNYRQATLYDLDKGVSMKLKDSNKNVLFMYRKGKIKKEKGGGIWEETEYTSENINLFCVLDF